MLITFLLVIFFEVIIGVRGNVYYKDIKEGPVEVVMTDAIIKKEYSGKSRHWYLIGDIDGKRVKLEVTRHARDVVSNNTKYKTVNIIYYKNLNEVYYIKI